MKHERCGGNTYRKVKGISKKGESMNVGILLEPI